MGGTSTSGLNPDVFASLFWIFRKSACAKLKARPVRGFRRFRSLQPPWPQPRAHNKKGKMPNDYDYKKFAVLYVDDEQMSLTAFSRAFGDDFRILTADNAQDGYQLLETHKDEIGLLMTDQRMPGEKG